MKTGALMVAAMALVIAACGGKSEQGTSAGPAGAAARDSGSRSDDVVSAVLQSPGTPVAKLAFQLETRPVAGTPFPVKLLASATEALPQLQVTIESTSLVAAPDTAVLMLDAVGTAVGHELTVTARQAGLAELTVRLKAGAVESVYVIPVLVAAAAAAG
jgi:hypothetical protein